MSVTNDDRPSSSFQAKRGLLVGGLLLFLAGGLYWFYTTPVSTLPTPTTSSVTKPAEQAIGTPQTATPEPKTGQELPDVTENRAETDVNESVTPASAKAVVTDRTTKRSANTVSEAVKPVEQSARVAAAPAAVPTPVEPPVVVATPSVAPAVKPEAAPITKAPVVAAASTAKPASPIPTARSKSGVPGDLKPVVQPAPAPVTVSAAPLLKRKTKNDEDVDVDF